MIAGHYVTNWESHTQSKVESETESRRVKLKGGNNNNNNNNNSICIAP